jgi:hypothetical protein
MLKSAAEIAVATADNHPHPNLPVVRYSAVNPVK